MFDNPPMAPGERQREDSRMVVESTRWRGRQPIPPSLAPILRQKAVQAIDADLPLMRQVEAEHVARLEAATTEAERDTASALLADIRSQIRATEERRVMVTTTQQASNLRDAWRAAAARVTEELRASQHEGFTKEYRDGAAIRLRREYERVTRETRERLDEWAATETTRADALYASDPAGDMASETRRLRQELEVKALVERYAGDTQRVQARNILLPEARRLISLGALDKAITTYTAAERLGVEDGFVAKSISDHLDATLPHRREAIEQREAVAREVAMFRLDVAKSRLMHGFGSVSDQNLVTLTEHRMRDEDAQQRANGGEARDLTQEPAIPRASGLD